VTARLRVRYSETDQYGVVYYANYLVWCEVGRTEYMRDVGLPYVALEELGLRFPVIDFACRLHAGARYDDEIEVVTWIEEIRSREITFEYEVRRGDETLATAHTVHLLLGPDGRVRALPVWLRKGLSDTLLAGVPPASIPADAPGLRNPRPPAEES
jgi:acyl-CoA thioester hydrolase